MKKTFFVKATAVLTMLALALVITGIPGTALATVSSVAITAADGESYTMPVGGTVHLTGSMTQTGTYTTQIYSWGKSNAYVSLSDVEGDTTTVTALTPGTTKITLTGTDDGDSTGKSTSITITVTAMTISKTALSLVGGATSTLTVGNTLSGSVTWASDNEDVATVSAAGLVTAVGAGTANITATSSPGGDADDQTKTCKVTVTPVITLTPATQTITAASTTGTGLVLTVKYGGDLISGASGVTWSTSSSSIGAIVGDTTFADDGAGTLTANADFTSSATAVNGTTTITAKIAGTGSYSTSATAKVTVRTAQYLDIVGDTDLTKSDRTETYTVYLKNADGSVVDNDSATVHWSWSSSYLSLTSDDINDNRADMHDGEAHIQLYARYNTPSDGTRLYVWLGSNDDDKVYHTIYITGLSSLPQTGQDMTLVYVFGGLGVALLAATGVWYGIRKKRTIA